LAQESEKQREELKGLHWMRCPKRGHAMKTTDIDGIPVDACSLCEKIYFDHGDLEALLMRKQEKRFHFYRRLFGLD
jgi:Zn-finger nucleic acid-binding protein